MKRHELLKRFFNDDITKVNEIREAKYMERIARPSRSQERTRTSDIDFHLSLVVQHHLEILEFPDLQAILTRGCDRAIEFFLGGWWEHHEDDQICMNKDHPEYSPTWLTPYCRSILLLSLANRWNDIQSISSWATENAETEFFIDPLDSELGDFVLFVAACLAGVTEEPASKKRGSIQEGNSMRAKVLLELFDAANLNDQKEFDRVLPRSVDLFFKNEEEYVQNCNYWVSVLDSFLVNFARIKHITAARLDNKSDAAIVRRENLFG